MSVTGRPRLLDLFCGAGGASVGYYQAGFDVVGVDIVPQPRYPFAFIQADALTVPLADYDAIHASPPCQYFSRMNAPWGREHPDLLGSTRGRLDAAGVPWVIENVEDARLDRSILLCGSMFGLRVIRHRCFESSHLLFAPGPCRHVYHAMPFGMSGCRESTYRDLMGVSWMRARKDARQAIPPAYTEWIGRQLLAVVRRDAQPPIP